MKNKLWLFGDSFMSYNENWVEELARRTNCEVAHLGELGSSVQFLLIDLLNSMDRIKRNDRVLIGITNPARFYFNSKHYHSLWIEHKDKFNLRYYSGKKYSTEELNCLVEYLMHFYHPDQDDIYKSAIVSHIINIIFPRISANHKQYVFTIKPEPYIRERLNFIELRDNEPPSFMDTALKFLEETYPTDERVVVRHVFDNHLNGNNHWIDHPDYFNYFWKVYDEHFARLY